MVRMKDMKIPNERQLGGQTIRDGNEDYRDETNTPYRTKRSRSKKIRNLITTLEAAADDEMSRTYIYIK